MSAWVLILWITTTNGGGITAVDFAKQDQCYKVLRMLKDINKTMDGVCIHRRL